MDILVLPTDMPQIMITLSESVVSAMLKRIDQSFTKFMIRTSSLSCGTDSKTALEKEAEIISNFYIGKYGIRPKNLYLKYLSFYLNHIKPDNFPYILKKLPKIAFLFFTLKILKY